MFRRKRRFQVTYLRQRLTLSTPPPPVRKSEQVMAHGYDDAVAQVLCPYEDDWRHAVRVEDVRELH